jgi:hypothetical protein
MSNLKSGLVLQDGEQVVVELEAELWSVSGNPIARFFGKLHRIISGFLGYRKKGFLVITDRRVVEILTIYQCYVFNTDKHVKYVLPASVREVGFTRETTCGVFCPEFKLYYEANTQSTSILLPTNDEKECQRYVDAFYNAISKH